jgi:hypothetical protein
VLLLGLGAPGPAAAGPALSGCRLRESESGY